MVRKWVFHYVGINPLLNSRLLGPHLVPPHPRCQREHPITPRLPGVSLIGPSWWIPAALGLVVSGSWYVRQKCVSARFVPFSRRFQQKGGVGTGNGERGPIYHPWWKWYVYLCELLILMVNVGKLQGWFGWFWLIWLIIHDHLPYTSRVQQTKNQMVDLECHSKKPNFVDPSNFAFRTRSNFQSKQLGHQWVPGLFIWFLYIYILHT